MSIWHAIAAALAAGEDPVVRLNYDEHLYRDVPKKRGPKPKKPRFTFAWNSTSPLGMHARPRCMNTHCRKRLYADQDLVCNENCGVLALEHFEAALLALQSRMKELTDVEIRGVLEASVPPGR